MSHPTTQQILEALRPTLDRWVQSAPAPKPQPGGDPHLMQAWWKAVQDRDTGQMRTLLAKGVRIDALSPAGKTALTFAVFHGEKSLIKLLLARGANPNVKCSVYGSPLSAAMFAQDDLMAQYLLDRSASPNSVDSDGNPVLAVALENRPDIAKKLILAGASLDWCDDKGCTPLLRALTYAQWNNALLLLQKGMDVNAVNHEGFTPLMLTVSLSGAPCGPHEVIRALLDAGAHIDTCLPSGATALMFAAVRDASGATVKLLLERGANPHVSCEKGSALHMAAQMGHQASVEWLTQYAANALHEKTVPLSDQVASEIRRL